MEHRGSVARAADYGWRLVATGACFAVFGIGGLLLSTFGFPLVILLSPAHSRLQRVRWLIRKSFATFIRFMEVAGVMRLRVTGAERLRNCGNALVLANHPSLIDVVALMSLMPNASCVVKRALWQNPLLGGVVRGASYISNDEPVEVVQDCVRDLQAGHPLVVFPEGTRSRPGEPLRFQRGAAHVALQAGATILPVLIRAEPPTLTKGAPWYRIPSRRFELGIEVLAPLSVAQWQDADEPPALAARRLTQQLEQFFTMELGRHGHAETGTQTTHHQLA